ncbi:MAG: ATP-binding protein [Campylobacterales bacterium]
MLDTFRKLEKQILKEHSIEYKRYLYSTIDFSSKLVGIVGARGVGKTTLLLQRALELKSAYEPHKSLYFSYDYPHSVDTKLIELAEEFVKLGGEYLLVDEIHKYSDFASDLKAIYDFYPKLKVIFTGSCATSIYGSQADLSRRVVLYSMKGLSYREFLEMKLGRSFQSFDLQDICKESVDIVDNIERDIVPLEYFGEYLRFGYYPFYFEHGTHYLRLLNAVINQTIDIDLVKLGLVKDSFTHKLKKLIFVISESEPFELNITKVASSIEVSRNTLYAYLNHLNKAALITSIMSSQKGISSMSKPEKLYLNNTNIFYALSSEAKVGTIRETFFVSQLRDIYRMEIAKKGDFLVDRECVFEVGGEGKNFSQIKDVDNAYLVIDTDSTQNPKKIPLWLFGFLY